MHAALQTVRGAVQRLVPTFLGRYGRLADSEHGLGHNGQPTLQQQVEPRHGASGSGGLDEPEPNVPVYAYPLLIAAVGVRWASMWILKLMLLYYALRA